MKITLNEAMDFCVSQNVRIEITNRGTVLVRSAMGGGEVSIQPSQLRRLMDNAGMDRSNAVCLEANGYESLALVLRRAFQQAASGKGKERHGQDLPFDHQPMQQLCGLYGVGFALGQAAKKAQESQRLPHDRAVNELLGAINYLAGAIIAIEKQNPTLAANDNAPCCNGGTQSADRCMGCVEEMRNG